MNFAIKMAILLVFPKGGHLGGSFLTPERGTPQKTGGVDFSPFYLETGAPQKPVTATNRPFALQIDPKKWSLHKTSMILER